MGSTTLTMTEAQHRRLRDHLYPGDSKEAVAMLLCGRRAGVQRHRLLVHDVVPIPYDMCSVREPDRVTWSTDALHDVLDRATKDKFAVVKVHSHPGGLAAFSPTDDVADRELLPSVYAWVDGTEPHGSAIMLPDGMVFGRAVAEDGRLDPFSRVTVVGRDIRMFDATAAPSAAIPAFAERVAQAFGRATLRRLSSMRVGVVGCSGTGSVVIEQLVRNGVGALVLVDPDLIEDKNLNRILNSTANDAGRTKVDVLAEAIHGFGLGTEVVTLPTDVRDPGAILALAECDVIFGCVDGIIGRHVLSRLSSYYLLPYFDVGVALGVDGAGEITRAEAAANYVFPGGPSLMSRGVYSQEDLDAEFMRDGNRLEYERLRRVGYIAGVNEDQPAVISVNMLAAALSVNDFLARIHGFREDGNDRHDRQIHSLYLGLFEAEQIFEPCAMFHRVLGRGDDLPLLGMPELGRDVAA